MARFSEQFLDRLRDAVPLSDLVGRAVRWDERKTRARHGDYWAPCPFHAENTASFHVRDSERHYHCFGCKASGDHFSYLIEREGFSFPEAVAEVASMAGIDLPASKPADQAAEARSGRLREVMAEAETWFYNRWRSKGDGVEAAKAYLKARRIDGETARRFRIGYAPKHGLLAHLRDRGFTEADMLEAGLAGKSDDGRLYERFRNRLMFPVHDMRGRAIGFGGRLLSGEDLARSPDGSHVRSSLYGGGKSSIHKPPKYLNTPATALYDKARVLFNWHRARKAAAESGSLYVVEGYLDAIALAAAGLDNVVAPCGTALTWQHLEMLWRHAAEPVVCFDGDAAGLAAMERAVDLALPKLRPGQTLRAAVLPDGLDPDDLMADHWGRQRFVEVIEAAEPASQLAWARLTADNDRATPEREARFIQDIGELVAAIEHPEVRQAYGRLYERRLKQDLKIRHVKLNRIAGRKRFGRARHADAGDPRAPEAGGGNGPSHMGGSAQTSSQGGAGGSPSGRDLAHRASPSPCGDGSSSGRNLAHRASPSPCDFDITPPQARAGHETDLACARYPLTDLGNSWRFMARHGHRFRFADEYGWLWFDGRRWALSGADHKVARAVQDTVTAIADEAQALVEAGEDEIIGEKRGEAVMLSDAVQAWCRASQAAGKIGCIAHLAQAKLAVLPCDLDADPFALTVLNGTLHFDRNKDDFVRFEAHDPDDLITKLAPVVYDPVATAPVYDAFMDMVQPDSSDRAYLHTVGGLSLTGDATVQQLWFWYGKGQNGKSTCIEAWSKVLGDYAHTVPIETFLDQGRGRTGDQATPHLIPLVGARLVRASEPDRGAKLSESLVKEITGGEPMKVRQLNKPFFDFKPQFKLIISGNYRPDIKGTDDGIWRRMKLVPWPVRVNDAQKDPDLPDKLASEASGILNRLIAGLQTYFLEGLADTEAVVNATAIYRDDSDPLGRFLKMCVVETGADADRVQSSQMYDVYVAWCKASGEKAWTSTGFGKAMGDRGLRRRKLSSMHFMGLKLVKHVSDFVDAHGNVRDLDDPEPGDE